MNTSKNEFLSSLLDDEAGGFEQRRLLDEMTKDDELAQTFGRYALIGEVMRSTSSGQRATTSVSLLARIQDELADEPAYNERVVVTPKPAIQPQHFWQRTGFALAASVAAVAFGSLLFLQQSKTPNAVQAQTTTAPQAVASAPAANTTITQVASVDTTEERISQIGQINPQTRDILKQYVSQHIKYASTTVIAPSVRAVSYANEN